MEIKTFHVGDRGGSLRVEIRDQRTGQPFSLSGYQGVRAFFVDSDNREFVLPLENVAITDGTAGIVTVILPQESIFTKPGYMQLQLEFSSPSIVRRSTVQEIRVLELGGVTK